MPTLEGLCRFLSGPVIARLAGIRATVWAKEAQVIARSGVQDLQVELAAATGADSGVVTYRLAR